MDKERIVLCTYELAFKDAVSDYAERKTIEKKIKDEVKKLLPDYKFNSLFYEDIEINFFNALEIQYPKYKELNIKATKIPELIDLDISTLKSLTDSYHRKNKNGIIIKEVKNPSISEFQILAETPDEVKQYNAATKFIKAVKELEIAFERQVYVGDIARGTKGILNANIRDGQGAQALKFNHYLILNQRRELQKLKQKIQIS